MRIFARPDRGNAQSARSRLTAEIATLRHTLSIVSLDLGDQDVPNLVALDRPEGESIGSLLDRLGEMLFIVLYECVGHLIANRPSSSSPSSSDSLAAPSSSSSSPLMPSAHCFRVPASMLPPRHRHLENALRRSPNRSALTQFRLVGQATIADRVIIPSL
jgi:hypothetical protein